MKTPPPPPRWAVVVPRFAAPLVLLMGLGYLALGTIRDIGLLQFVGAMLCFLGLVISLVAVLMWRRDRQSRERHRR